MCVCIYYVLGKKIYWIKTTMHKLNNLTYVEKCHHEKLKPKNN